MNQLIFQGRIGIDLQLYYGLTLSPEVFKHTRFKHFKERKYYYGRTSANENLKNFFLNIRYYFFNETKKTGVNKI